MSKNRIMLITLVTMLTIGFASLTTNLIINSKVDIGLLESDLDVIFKEVLLNKENNDKAFIIENGKSFIYSADELVNINQTSNIDYTIMNKSHQYDMEVKVTCTSDYKEYLKYTSETIDKSILIEAGEVISGNIITELIKEKEFEDSLVLKCTLNYIPVSRDSIVEEKEYVVSFDTGYEEKVSDVKVKYYETYGSLPTLERKGYTFLGWYTADDIKVENNSLVKIKDNHILHAKWEKICEYDIGKTWEFNYTGSEQTFTTPCDGEYKIELWGAQGNSPSTHRVVGGYGAYASGKLIMIENEKYYIYIGQHLETAISSSFNSGSTGGANNEGGISTPCGHGGGGATDVRLINGTWNNFSSLKSRIMVAAGGGGASNYIMQANGGAAGGLIGYSGINNKYSSSSKNVVSIGGNQTSGGVATNSGSGAVGHVATSGYFGVGGNGGTKWGSGAGGGYYGGGGGGATSGSVDSGAGGSSFISGHNGCDAVAESSTQSKIIHTGQPNHYSGYVFKDTVMIDGNGYKWTNVKGAYTGMPTHDGKSTMTGNSGNGYAKITYLG